MGKDYNDYIERKSLAVKNLFKIKAPKGMSDNEFSTMQKNKIIEILNINPDFFLDIKIEGKNILDYYSSQSSGRERSSFFKVLSVAEIINKMNLSSEHVYSISNNIIEEIKNNKFDETKKELKFLSKLIFKCWKKDIDLLTFDKFNGGNICSHFISGGISNYFIFRNEINNFNVNKIGIKKEEINNFTELDLDKSTFSFLYFTVMKNSFSKKINSSNNVVEENLKLISDNGLNEELEELVKKTFSVVEKQFISNKVLDLINMDNIDHTKSKKNKKRI